MPAKLEKNPIIVAIVKHTESDKRSRKEDDQDYLERILFDVAELSDKDFDKLPDEAKDWSNEAGNALNQEEDIPLPPEEEEEDEEEEKPRGRRSARGRSRKERSEKERGRSRRGGREEEDEEEEKPRGGRARRSASRKRASKKGVEFSDVEEGQVLRLEVDGDEVEGDVTKKTARSIVITTDDGDVKVTKAMLKTAEILDGDAEEEEEEKPRGGRTRGKRVQGRTGRRESRAEAEDDDTVKAIREILVDDPDLDLDALKHILEEEEIEAKPALVKMTYNSFRAIYDMLEQADMLAV